MEGKLNLKVKHLNDKAIDLTVNKEDTVLQVKQQLSQIINIPAGEQKLISKGKILKDEDRAGDILEEGSAIHAIRNRAATGDAPKATTGTGAGAGFSGQGGIPAGGNADPFAAFGGAGAGAGFGGLGGMGMGGLGGLGMGGLGGIDPNMMEQALNNPEAQRMMQDMFSNPEQLRNMINSHPQLQAMVNSNPQMRMMLENPQMLQMMSQMMQNPALLGGLGGLGGPAGVNPNAGFGGQAGAGGAGGMDLNGLLASLGGGQAGAGGAGFNLGAFMPPHAAPNPNLPPQERYKDQLQQMADMGFTNVDLNIQMLDATQGNVQLAIERMLNMLN